MGMNAFEKACTNLTNRIKRSKKKFSGIYGIPRGGYKFALELTKRLKLPRIWNTSDIKSTTLIVDDISDTGKTLLTLKEKLKKKGVKLGKTVTLYYVKGTKFKPTWTYKRRKKKWITFWWEIAEGDEDDKKQTDITN